MIRDSSKSKKYVFVFIANSKTDESNKDYKSQKQNKIHMKIKNIYLYNKSKYIKKILQK